MKFLTSILLIALSLPALPLAAFSQGRVELTPGTTLSLANGAYFVIDNANLVNNGSVQTTSGTSVLKFTGNTNLSLSGSGTTSLHSMELALGSGQLNLQKNISISSTLNFNGGLLNLTNSVIDLGTTGSLTNESEASRAFTTGTGYIQATANLVAPSSVNPGNLGAMISSSANLGSTVIRRGHQSQSNGYGNGNSILRYYDISPTNNSSLNATLRFYYFDAELNGLDENTLVLWKSSNLLTWSNMGFSTRNTTSNYVEKTGLTDFSRWTLSSPANILPVQFTLVNAKCNNGNIIISWNTAAQMNVMNFVVEKSIDGSNWQEAGTLVPLQGNNNSYSFSLPSSSFSFFRVRENSYSGSRTYSSIVKSSCDGAENFSLWPNPVKDRATVSITVNAATKATLFLYDSKGALLRMQTVGLLAGSNTVEVNTSMLPSAVYSLQLQWNGKTDTKRFIKQ